MAIPGREISERHSVGATDAGIHMLHSGSKAVRWQPAGEGIRFEKGAVDFLRGGAQYTVKLDCRRCHGEVLLALAGSYAVAGGWYPLIERNPRISTTSTTAMRFLWFRRHIFQPGSLRLTKPSCVGLIKVCEQPLI